MKLYPGTQQRLSIPASSNNYSRDRETIIDSNPVVKKAILPNSATEAPYQINHFSSASWKPNSKHSNFNTATRGQARAGAYENASDINSIYLNQFVKIITKDVKLAHDDKGINYMRRAGKSLKPKYRKFQRRNL